MDWHRGNYSFHQPGIYAAPDPPPAFFLSWTPRARKSPHATTAHSWNATGPYDGRARFPDRKNAMVQ